MFYSILSFFLFFFFLIPLRIPFKSVYKHLCLVIHLHKKLYIAEGPKPDNIRYEVGPHFQTIIHTPECFRVVNPPMRVLQAQDRSSDPGVTRRQVTHCTTILFYCLFSSERMHNTSVCQLYNATQNSKLM